MAYADYRGCVAVYAARRLAVADDAAWLSASNYKCSIIFIVGVMIVPGCGSTII
jgi:hypothetical protein